MYIYTYMSRLIFIDTLFMVVRKFKTKATNRLTVTLSCHFISR